MSQSSCVRDAQTSLTEAPHQACPPHRSPQSRSPLSAYRNPLRFGEDTAGYAVSATGVELGSRRRFRGVFSRSRAVVTTSSRCARGATTGAGTARSCTAGAARSSTAGVAVAATIPATTTTAAAGRSAAVARSSTARSTDRAARSSTSRAARSSAARNCIAVTTAAGATAAATTGFGGVRRHHRSNRRKHHQTKNLTRHVASPCQEVARPGESRVI